MAEAPRILLEHHLKKLKLPTFLREYEKLARQCATEGLDHVQFLARLVEMEMIDRERRLVERRIRQARFPVVKQLESFDFKAIPSLNKMLMLGFQDQGDGGEALLAVIDQVRRPVGVVRIDGGEADHGAEEMLAQVGALAGVEDVLPELSVFPPRPCVAALVDGHEELGCLPDEVEEEGFRGAHGGLRIGGTGYGPDLLGVVGPRPAECTSPLFAMCGKTVSG